jgi:uncharacterized membrane protein
MNAIGAVRHLEGRVAGLLRLGTYAGVALIASGVLLLVLAGNSPLDGAPGLDLGRLFGEVLALEPQGFLWLGILVALATPIGRVVLALAGFLRLGEREMALVAILILAIVALGVVAGTAGA